jgi:hypothetical protein
MTSDLTTIDEPRQLAVEERPVANDLRHAMMTLPVEHQNVMLAEYKARRDNFRRWLMSQLVEGVHYGFPPGCEPKSKEIDGVTYYAVWMRGGEQWFPSTQWKPKPPLYAAGADFVCDLLGVRAVFAADVAAWQQLGSRPGAFVISCHLFSRANGELIGEGRGCRSEGDKKGDANNAIKMAEKSAKVDAVINSYGLRDLFTQDEIPEREPHDNPEADHDAPAAAPRDKRRDAAATVEAVKRISAKWKDDNKNVYGDDPNGISTWAAEYKKWVMRTCDRVFNPAKPDQWTPGDIGLCERALGIEGETC